MARPDPAPAPRAERRAILFSVLCGIANVGGVMAYLPLLSLLLPMKVEAAAGDARLDVFTACVVTGGVVASGANILFGWLSDRSAARGYGRRAWLIGGMVAVVVAFAAMARAQDAAAIIVATALFQLAVNVLLAPLAAILAEEVPDGEKGLLGGLLSLGYPVAALFSSTISDWGPREEAGHLTLVFAAMAAAILPLTLIRLRSFSAGPTGAPTPADPVHGDLWVAWAARLLVQVAGAVLSLYLIYYFESLGVAREGLAPRTGYLLGFAYLIPVPLALIAGRWSDRIDRRKPFLIGAAMVAATGLGAMAMAWDWTSGAVAFALYAAGNAVFLSLHASFAMQLLPDPRHHGRDLGLINLANTLPILIGPLLTWALATPHVFGAALGGLALLALAGGLIVFGVRGRD